VRAYADRGGSVLATSHILADIEANADRVVAIGSGRVVRRGSVADIRALLGGSLVSLRLPTGEVDAVIDRIAQADLGQLHTSDPGGVTTWRTDRPASW